MNKKDLTRDRLYLTSNENLKEIFENIGINPQKVLTVGSSSDQLYNSIFYGAQSVTVADNSKCAKPFSELKTTALLNLDFQEFQNFIYDLPKFTTYNPTMYQQIQQNLSHETKEFWKDMFDPENRDILENMIDVDIDFEGSRFYNNENDYYKLKNILEENEFKTNIIQEDLLNFPVVLNDKYDLILLSNVDDYFMDQNNKNKIYEFFEAVYKLYKNNLNDGGVIQLTSSMNQHNKTKTNFYKNICHKYFKNGDFFTIENSGLYSTNGSTNKSFFVKKREKENEKTNDDFLELE